MAVRDSSGGPLLAAAIAAGLVAGPAVFAMGSIVGGRIYLSGGGAWLVVAGTLLLPGVVAAGCGALVLHYRSHPRWIRLTAVLVAIEVAIAVTLAQLFVGSAATLAVAGVSVGDLESKMVLYDNVEVAVGNFVLVTGLVAIVAVPLFVGGLVPARPPLRSRRWHLAAGAGWLLAATLSYVVADLVILSDATLRETF